MVEKKSPDALKRREFVRKSLVAIAGIGTLSLAGYGFSNRKKLHSLNNMLLIGHCAPSVMQTLIELNDEDVSNLVIYAGAMAGGIAGSDMECGALTAPLMFVSSQMNPSSSINQKLELIGKSQLYVDAFTTWNNSCICRVIQGRGISSCMKAACTFHQPFSAAFSASPDLNSEKKESCTQLISAFDDASFHCAHHVLRNLNGKITLTAELLNSSWIFLGGIAMKNQTCGALTGGVMALSAATAKMEHEYSRVARMTWLLMHNKTDEAMKEEMNNFNRSIRLSEELGNWFRNEFGSTSCSRIWGYDFAKMNDAKSFINGSCIKHCKNIAEKVVEKVTSMI